MDKKILEFKVSNVYKEIEDILYELDISKAVLIVEDLLIIDKLKEVLKVANIKISGIYNLYEIVFNEYKEVIVKENEEYFFISDKDKKSLNFTDDDNIDLSGMRVFDANILYENILALDKIRAKNLNKNDINIKYYILLFILLFSISYLILDKIYDVSKLDMEKKNKELNLRKIERDYQIYNLEIEKEMEKKELIFIYDSIEKYSLKEKVDKLLNMSKNYFYFTEIYINNESIRLKGECSSLKSLDEEFKKYTIYELLKYDKYIYFDISYTLKEKNEKI
ncbi:hypothetical protein [Oceanivirga miroungae]|nr:hypothetical protein [Oceanivirga miroungae]